MRLTIVMAPTAQTLSRFMVDSLPQTMVLLGCEPRRDGFDNLPPYKRHHVTEWRGLVKRGDVRQQRGTRTSIFSA